MPRLPSARRAGGVAVSVSDILLCAVAIARDWPHLLDRPRFPLLRQNPPPEIALSKVGDKACPAGTRLRSENTRCFCQRVWNLLKRKGLSFWRVQKSAKECATA